MTQKDTATIGDIGSLKLIDIDAENGMIHVEYSGPVPMRRLMVLVISDMCGNISEIDRPHRSQPTTKKFEIEVLAEGCDKDTMTKIYKLFVKNVKFLLENNPELARELCSPTPCTIALAVHAEATGYEVS